MARYLIHSDDAAPIATQGLTAARKYALIAPDAPHAGAAHARGQSQAGEAPRVTRRSAKLLVRRARADADVAEAIDYDLAESPASALRFVDALEAAYMHIRRVPATGSPRYAHELNLPGLRQRPIRLQLLPLRAGMAP